MSIITVITFIIFVGLSIYLLLMLAELNALLESRNPDIFKIIGSPNSLTERYGRHIQFDRRIMKVINSTNYDDKLDPEIIVLKKRFLKIQMYWNVSLVVLLMLSVYFIYVSA